jgi:hypothetical protein
MSLQSIPVEWRQARFRYPVPTSIPTARINARALLFVTTPGRIV